jgi:hypothetical protein
MDCFVTDWAKHLKLMQIRVLKQRLLPYDYLEYNAQQPT